MGKYINLTQNKRTLVDDQDYEWLNRFKWVYKGTGVCRSFSFNHKKYHVYMHRLLLGARDGLEVDHINHDPLDNRRSNLRLCTHRQNLYNREKRQDGYKGVFKQPNGGWRAQVKCNGKPYYLGCFKDSVEAARAYDRKAIELFGEFADVNFK